MLFTVVADFKEKHTLLWFLKYILKNQLNKKIKCIHEKHVAERNN
jgi:hypothetical protein